MRSLGYKEFLDIALGGTILGTGGGGSFRAAKALADGWLRRKSIQMTPLSGVQDQASVVTVAGMGSPEAMLRIPFTTQAQSAFASLEESIGERIQYVLPVEASGFNFLTPMTVAAHAPVTLVDADGAGRAIPHLNQSLLFAEGIHLTPMALGNAPGETVVIRTDSYALAERLALSALEDFGWLAGLACYRVSGRIAKRVCISGTISLAQEVGRAIREAVASEQDPVPAVLGKMGGAILVRGRVERVKTESKGSYTFGLLDVRGTGEYRGCHVRVKSMNENMIALRNQRPAALAPDRICYMTPDGSATTNADLRPNDEVVVLVVEAQKEWRSKAASVLFSDALRAMGYPGRYVPARKLLRMAQSAG